MMIAAIMGVLMVWPMAQDQGVSADSAVHVMSFNIRYNNPSDGTHAWPHRKERVAGIMQRADIIGVQEALQEQVADLEALLPEYRWLGVGRDDGGTAGEFAPVFFRRDRFEVVAEGTFWLSEQPEVAGSKSWDAAITRIVTWVQFRDRQSGAVLWHFNTHFDHIGEEARIKSARLLMARMDALADAAAQIVVTGDFNATPDSEVYDIMTGGRLVDTRAHSMAAPRGPIGTFTGFEVGRQPPSRRIDYIFVDRRMSVEYYEAVDEVQEGAYASDHRAVRVGMVVPH